MTVAGRLAAKTALCCMATTPAICGQDAIDVPVCRQLVPGWLAKGAPSVVKSIPAVAGELLDMTVLLINFTFNESRKETPPPSQPATLLVMMLLVIFTEFQY